MKIVTAALFITVFLSVIDGVVTNHLSQPKSVESINNATTTTQLKNRTMVQLQSNSHYPVQVITLPILMNDNMTNNDNDNGSSTIEQGFRLLLPPHGYDDTLCTPVSSMVNLQPNKTVGDLDSLYPTGLLIKTNTTNNCTLSNIVSNVIELNRMLPESELIQYLILTQDDSSNVSSYMQIDTIINQVNNSISSSEELPTSNAITIIYVQSYYVNEIMKVIDEMIIGCSPFLLESENNITTTCNFIYQLNETTTVNNANSNLQQQTSPTNPYLSLQAVYGYVYLMLAALAWVLLIVSCIYRRYHPVLVIVPAQSPSQTIEKEKNPAKLTEKQFESLPETKYALDLVVMLKKYGNNNNNVTSNTTALDDSTAMDITSSMEQHPTNDELITVVKDCLSTDMTNTTRINDDDENKLNCSSCHKNKMSDLEAPLQTTIRLDSSRNNFNSDSADECDICCPICIEDFIVDEIVIVLPKCNHIYHKHCIKQWLMKKQGCCPYCKVVVIDDDVAIDNDTKNDDNSQGIIDMDNIDV